MDTITVLPESSSMFNLQKLVLSDQLYDSSVNGQIAYICTPEVNCLCQIFLSKILHPSFCYIDCSVANPGAYKKPNNTYPSRIKLKSLTLSNITNILPMVDNIKSVSVHLVFDTPLSASKWKSNLNYFRDIVKHLLQLFVLMNGAIISLEAVKTLFDVNIEHIYIEAMDVNIGHVVSATKVKIEKMLSRLTYEQIFMNVNLPLIGGLEVPLQKLRSIIEKLKMSEEGLKYSQYKQVLIMGPPGCGKTSMVFQAAAECQVVVKTVDGPELANPLPGESERLLGRIFDECKLLAEECPGGCLLLMKHVETVCGRHDGSAGGHIVRLATRLSSLLESVNSTPGLMVVGTSTCPEAVDPAVRRPGRFDHEIHMSMSSEDERASVLRAVTKQYGLSPSICDEVAKWTPGYVGADLALLVANLSRHLAQEGLPQDLESKDELLIYWKKCVARLQPSSLRGRLGVVIRASEHVSPLGGVDHFMLKLRQVVQWPLLHTDAFKRMGLPQPKGVLLYGPPGCAKTSLARAIAAESNTTFLAVSAAQIYSPYIGDAERIIAELFHRARIGSPSILFIDEIDALVGCRGHREKGSQERILTSFLTEMDGVGVRLDSGAYQGSVVVIAATNRPDVLDPALTRPGRFDKLIYIAPPNTLQRLSILHKLTEKMSLNDDVDLTSVAEQTNLYSGADLARLCKEAGLCALTQEGMDVTQVSHRHWMSALSDMKPSLSAEQVLKYQDMSALGDK